MASRKLQDLEPEMAIRARAFLALVNLAIEPKRLSVFITDGLRTYTEQDYLFAKGRHPGFKGKTVTKVTGGRSWHNLGRAIDVAFRKLDEPDPRKSVTWRGPYNEVGKIGMSLGLEWGFQLWGWDRPHFHLSRGLTLAQARRQFEASPLHQRMLSLERSELARKRYPRVDLRALGLA